MIFLWQKKIGRFVIWLGVLLVSSALIWLVWYESSKLYDLYTGWMPMYDLKIELKVGDEIVKINRYIPCEKVYQSQTLPYLFTWNTRPWKAFPREMSVGSSLSDGRAVMVAVPSVCRKIFTAARENKTSHILPDNFVPNIAILDDEDDPQVMKMHFSRSQLARSDNLVSLIKYEILPTKAGNFPSFRGKFNWLSGCCDRKRGRFLTQYLAGIPLSSLRKRFPEAKHLGERVSLFALKLKQPVPSVNGLLIPKVKFFEEGFGNISLESSPDAKEISVDHVVPIIRGPEGDTYDPNQKGYLVYYKVPYAWTEPTEIRHLDKESGHEIIDKVFYEYTIFKGNSKLHLRKIIQTVGKTSQKFMLNPIFYDPETRFLYEVRTQNRGF